MDDLQFEALRTLLTEIRDDQRAFIRLMQEPAPEPVHVHTPIAGTLPGATFWVCVCGYTFDSERTE